MKKKLLLVLTSILLGTAAVACGKNATKKYDNVGIYEEQISYIETSRLAAEKSTLQELKTAIKNAMCEGYEDVKATQIPVKVDSEGKIKFASLFDTSNDGGRNFVKAIEEYMGTDCIIFSSKRKEDCSLQIVNFDIEDMKFTIKLVSEITGENMDI